MVRGNAALRPFAGVAAGTSLVMTSWCGDAD